MTNNIKAICKDCSEICRICHRGKDVTGKMRPLFDGDRLPKLIHNVMHIEIKEISGLPNLLCEKCLECLKKFASFQLTFRRSEENYRTMLENQKTAHMDELNLFARNIEQERQKEKGEDAKKPSGKVTNKSKKKKGHGKSKK